jgi:serine/threonine-protein kinase
MSDLGVGERLDQYLITDVLARTEMATVFAGRDAETGSRVCLKVPHLHYESDVVFHERFLREEAILRRCDHPRVVRPLEPRRKSRIYTVLEYLEGKTLRVLIASRAVSVEQSVDIARQLCETLEHLHAHRIIHRDVKPENLIVDAAGRIKLFDFGIALDRAARRLTWGRMSHVAGTPDYVAPERIQGGRATHVPTSTRSASSSTRC